jgi:hypothetical protein
MRLLLSRASHGPRSFVFNAYGHNLTAARRSGESATGSTELGDVRRWRIGIFFHRFQIFFDLFQRG